MDGRTNQVADKSGNNNTGQLISMSTSSSPIKGQIGQALKFDGVDDYVEVADNDNLTPANITISYWVKPRSLGIGTQDIISKRTGGNVGGYLFESAGGGNIIHFFRVGDSWFSAVVEYTNNEWQHITATYDGETIRVYRNAGTPVENTTPSGNLNNDTAVLRIGKDSEQSDARHFDGSIDDVRVYNRALSPQEIQQLYNMGR